MQKIRKILKVVSEKTALATNQPIINNNTDFIGPGWRRSKKTVITSEPKYDWECGNQKSATTSSGFLPMSRNWVEQLTQYLAWVFRGYGPFDCHFKHCLQPYDYFLDLWTQKSFFLNLNLYLIHIENAYHSKTS